MLASDCVENSPGGRGDGGWEAGRARARSCLSSNRPRKHIMFTGDYKDYLGGVYLSKQLLTR